MPNDYITQIQDTNGATYDIRDPSKQDLLVSGTNIKTINGTSVLGSGDISIDVTITYIEVKASSGTNRSVVTSAINNRHIIIAKFNGNDYVVFKSVSGSTHHLYAVYSDTQIIEFRVSTAYPTSWDWTITDLQEELVSGTNIKTIN